MSTSFTDVSTLPLLRLFANILALRAFRCIRVGGALLVGAALSYASYAGGVWACLVAHFMSHAGFASLYFNALQRQQKSAAAEGGKGGGGGKEAAAPPAAGGEKKKEKVKDGGNPKKKK